jgi:hypothetical protein
MTPSDRLLNESLAMDGLVHLASRRCSHEFLFPNIEKIAEEVKRFATSPHPDFQ